MATQSWVLGRRDESVRYSASSTVTTPWIPEVCAAIVHLREVLGDPIDESLARTGETMTAATMVTYAYDQIDQARMELEAATK